MKPITILASISLVFVMTGAWILTNQITVPRPIVIAPRNISFLIDGKPTNLMRTDAGNAAATGVAVDSSVQYFGDVAKGDLNADGVTDVSFIVTQSPGGSGTFYYVVVALQRADGEYIGTNGVLLGDRITPQSTEIHDGKIVVTYADRDPDEPMTTSPSIESVKVLKVVGTSLAIVDDEE